MTTFKARSFEALDLDHVIGIFFWFTYCSTPFPFINNLGVPHHLQICGTCFHNSWARLKFFCWVTVCINEVNYGMRPNGLFLPRGNKLGCLERKNNQFFVNLPSGIFCSKHSSLFLLQKYLVATFLSYQTSLLYYKYCIQSFRVICSTLRLWFCTSGIWESKYSC